jgi:hypothetical protein
VWGQINTAVDAVKNGLDAQIALATAEQKEQLADAKLALAEIKIAFAQLKEENAALKKRNDLANKITSSSKCYSMDIGNGQKRAICTKCWEDDGKAISLNNLGNGAECPKCKNWYEINENQFENLKD